MLFGLEVTNDVPEQAIARYWREMGEEPEGREYADALVLGVWSSLERVDQVIVRASKNWRLDRMTRVDRNVLRIGTWELLNKPDVPRAVILDEAVELAKRFGTEESGAFVNGVLDKIATDLGRIDTDR